MRIKWAQVRRSFVPPEQKRKKQMEINKILYFISYADSIEGINGANIQKALFKQWLDPGG